MDPVLTTDPTYQYYVTADNGSGNVSDASNIAMAPSDLPPTTFTGLLTWVSVEKARGFFVSTGSGDVGDPGHSIGSNRDPNGNLKTALTSLQTLDQQVVASNVMLYPDMGDFDILLAKLERRLKLANSLLVDRELLN